MEIKFILESLLFSAQRPMSAQELRGVIINAATEEHADEAAKPFKKIKEDDVSAALAELSRDHETAARSYRLVCVAGAWQFVTQPEYAPWLKALVGVKNRPARLSQAALETLAIIAYRQPVTRAEVEQVRGVNVDGTMQTILERGLVEQSGRAEVVGRPALYSTTPFFLEYFGLRGLDDLPAADELRRIPIERPPAPVTAEPGLATVPPEQLQLNTDEEAPAAAGAGTMPEAEAKPDPEKTSKDETAPEAEAAPATEAEAGAEPDDDGDEEDEDDEGEDEEEEDDDDDEEDEDEEKKEGDGDKEGKG